MPSPHAISLVYYGREADEHRLDLYDASNSYYGLARTLSILGHYYLKEEIIVHAPRSAMPLYLVPPEEGSFKQTIIVGIVSGIVAAPFSVFATRLIESWVPSSPNPQLQEVIELLKEQNQLLRKSMHLPKVPTEQEKAEDHAVEKFIKDKNKDMQVLRSATSQSFKMIYRPIARSADQVGLIGGLGGTPKAIVDAAVLARIKADEVDDNEVTLMAVVNSFSRTSKTGIAYSRDYDASFRFEFSIRGRLPREDDFSWSQYMGKPVRMTGRFVRFFDGKVKKLLVFKVSRVTDQADIDDYFSTQRELRTF